MTNKQILECAKLFHKYSIRLRTENMLALPYETFADVLSTLELNMRCKPDIAWASLYTPYPGTELGDYCQKAGLLDKQVTSIQADFFTNSVLNLKDKKRIERLQKLFSLFCACPSLYEWIKPLAWMLTSLPFTYRRVYNKVKQYLYDRRLFKI